MNLRGHGLRVFCLVMAGMLFAQLPATAMRTVPIWQSSFISGGITYSIRLVGTDPAKGAVTTVVVNTIVPMRLVFSDGAVLDSQNDAAPLVASPIYAVAAFPSGNTQFADAVLRGELWQSVHGTEYHVLLGAPSVSPTYLLNVPAIYGKAAKGPHGTLVGTVDFDWFVKVVQPGILTQLAIDPATLTLFLTHNVQLKRPGRSCCVHGHHASYEVIVHGSRNRFTTVWAGAAVGTVVTMAHEVAEWANDPFNDNDVPNWEKPNVEDCNKHLEVGDPLTGVMFRAGGYSLQDVAYAQWFSRQVPSTAIGGRYDVLGKLTSVSEDCADAAPLNG